MDFDYRYETPESLKNIKKFYEKRKEIKEVNNMNICKTCLKIYVFNCPLYKHGPNNMIHCSAYKTSRDDRISVLEIKFDYLEDKIEALENGIIGHQNSSREVRGYNRKQSEANEKRITALEKQQDSRWEQHLIDINLVMGKLNRYLQINADEYKKLTEHWTRQQSELDEVFNRLDHHSAFYARFTKLEKILGKFMELLVNPSDSSYQVREFYRKLKKLIRELKR